MGAWAVVGLRWRRSLRRLAITLPGEQNFGEQNVPVSTVLELESSSPFRASLVSVLHRAAGGQPKIEKSNSDKQDHAHRQLSQLPCSR